MFIPYFYQDDCLRAVRRVRLKGVAQALAVMASGLGKTVTMAFDALAFRKQFPKARVLYMCDQNHILSQSRTTFEVINGSDCTYGFYHGTEKAVHKVDFLFASLQTMRKHMKRFRPDDFDYVVVDESHHTFGDTYLDVVTYWKPKFLLGMTATPDRTDGQDIRRVFGKEIFYLPLEEALAQGLLTPVDYRLMTDEIQIKKKIETEGRRVSVAMLNRNIFVPKRDEEIIRIIRKHATELDSPKIIIFCKSVPYCNHLAKTMDGAMPIHHKIPLDERIVRVELFRQGVISILLVVNTFNEGVDIPEANMLVFLRDTKSHLVLFQQLGRGLRLSNGKDKVIVLDFVGNCERVETIYTLWNRIKKCRAKLLVKTSSAQLKKRHVLPSHVDPFYLNVATVNFQEKIVKIIDVIRRISEGYTREECITMMQEFAKKLGRSPTQKEVHENRSMPSLAMYLRYFTNFTQALQGSGLIANQLQDVSDDELLEQLRNLQTELGHPPSQREIATGSKQGKCSCQPVFRKRFGSLSKAIELIGSKPERHIGLSKKDLCAQLRRLRDKLGRIPTVADLETASAARETSSYTVFWDRFGSWNKALRAARLTTKVIKPRAKLSDEELIAELKKAHKLLGRVPTSGDVIRLYKKGKLRVGWGAFASHFGSVADTLEVAGIKK